MKTGVTLSYTVEQSPELTNLLCNQYIVSLVLFIVKIGLVLSLGVSLILIKYI